MSLLRRLVSHGFLVAAVLLALLAYIFRNDLFTDAANQNKLATDEIAEDTSVVLTAEQVAEGMESSDLAAPADLSANLPGFRPNVDVAPVHVDIDDEIKKIAPPLDEEPEKQAVPAAKALDDTATKDETTAAATENIDTSRVVNSHQSNESNSEIKPVEAQIDSQAKLAVSQATASVQGDIQPESQPHSVDGTKHKADDGRIETSAAGEITANSSVNPQPKNSYRGSYGPVHSESLPEQQQKNNAGRPETNAQKMLRLARDAFWKGDIDEAVEKYTSLIATSGENPDFYGELGNVYYANGKWDDAANMYYEAGVRLVNQKHYGPAMHMVSLLRGLKSDKANLLDETVTKSAWPNQK